MKKPLYTLLILIMVIISFGTAFADEGVSIDINAYGDISVENITLNDGGGSLDSTYKPARTISVSGTETVSFDHLSDLGDYYYEIKQVIPSPEVNGVNYDKSEYIAWVSVTLDDNGNIERHVVLQKDKSGVIKDESDLDDRIIKADSVSFTNTKVETKKITRTITYTEYSSDGNKVFDTKVQEATLTRTVQCDAKGNNIETSPKSWTLVENESDISEVQSPTKSKWTADQSVVGKWSINLNDPKDEVVHVIYTPDAENIEREETTEITRTITYTEYTEDGTEVSKPVIQTVKLKRTVTYDPTGTKVISTGPWAIASDESTYGAVDSPTKSGWTPNTKRVGVWNIDLENPKDEIVHVVYTKDPEPPIETVEVVEYITIKRTITFTEYTAYGKEVASTVVQTVTLQRVRTEDSDGNILSYGDWEYVSGDKSAVPIPPKSGWTTNISEILPWEIDMEHPELSDNEVIHVIYTPISSGTQASKPSGGDQSSAGTAGPKTGDDTVMLPWAVLLAAAVGGLVLLKKRYTDV